MICSHLILVSLFVQGEGVARYIVMVVTVVRVVRVIRVVRVAPITLITVITSRILMT